MVLLKKIGIKLAQLFSCNLSCVKDWLTLAFDKIMMIIIMRRSTNFIIWHMLNLLHVWSYEGGGLGILKVIAKLVF